MASPARRWCVTLVAAGIVFAGVGIAFSFAAEILVPEPASLIAARGSNRPKPPGPRWMPAMIPALETGVVSPEQLRQVSAMGTDDILRWVTLPLYRPQGCLEPSTLDHPLVTDSLDVVHYDLFFREVNEATQIVRATAIVTLRALRPLETFDLDMARLTVTDVALRAEKGQPFLPVGYACNDTTLAVGPFPSASAGDTLAVRIQYEGDDPSCVSQFGIPSGVIFNSLGVYTFSEPSAARHWFPGHDAPWDKATASIRIRVPPGRVASATGVRTPQTESDTVSTWILDKPAATYLLAFYLGDYVKLEDRSPGGVPLQYFTYPDRVEETKTDYATVPEMVDFYSQLYPYPFPQYAMTLGFFGGGMEHQTNSLIAWRAITGDRSFEDLFAHELAHQWWGDLVTPATWREIWLNEGFATYFDLLFTEHRYGWAALQERMAVLDSVYQARPDLDHPVLNPAPDHVLSFIEYNKGARILHMLRGVSRLRLMGGAPAPPSAHREAALAGDERFFSIFARYARTHAYGNVTSADFQQAAEASLGENLTWFFHPWLYGTGYPRLDVDWRSTPTESGCVLRVRVRQTQSGALYPMPLQVRYVSADRVLDEVRDLTGVLTEWNVDLPAGDWRVVLDPDDWLLDRHQRVDLFPELARLTVSPNPSHHGFTFAGELVGDGPEQVVLSVIDIQGRRMDRRDLGWLGPGPVQFSWNCVSARGRKIAPGVYFARIHAGRRTRTLRLVVLR